MIRLRFVKGAASRYYYSAFDITRGFIFTFNCLVVFLFGVALFQPFNR